MFDFFVLIKNLWQSIFDVFAKYPLSIAGYKVSFMGIVFAFIVIGFAVSYFWKGART